MFLPACPFRLRLIVLQSDRAGSVSPSLSRAGSRSKSVKWLFLFSFDARIPSCSVPPAADGGAGDSRKHGRSDRID